MAGSDVESATPPDPLVSATIPARRERLGRTSDPVPFLTHGMCRTAVVVNARTVCVQVNVTKCSV
jgi:hypothetical protein